MTMDRENANVNSLGQGDGSKASCFQISQLDVLIQKGLITCVRRVSGRGKQIGLECSFCCPDVLHVKKSRIDVAGLMSCASCGRAKARSGFGCFDIIRSRDLLKSQTRVAGSRSSPSSSWLSYFLCIFAKNVKSFLPKTNVTNGAHANQRRADENFPRGGRYIVHGMLFRLR